MSLILKSLHWRPSRALVLAFMCIVSTSHAKNLDSLKQVIAGMMPGVAQADAHLELADDYAGRALYAEALKECERALELKKAHGDALDEADATVRLGVAFGATGDSDKGITLVKKGLATFNARRHEDGIARATTSWVCCWPVREKTLCLPKSSWSTPWPTTTNMATWTCL